MKRKIVYKNNPFGNAKVGKRVKDFLPSPEELAAREEIVKVAISLSKRSVDFFKHEAVKNEVPYQSMIRKLLDNYAENFTK